MGFWSVGKWREDPPLQAPGRMLTFHALAGREHRGETRGVRSTGGPIGGPGGQFFGFEYLAVPDPTVENIRVVQGADSLPFWDEWYPPIFAGVSRELERVTASDRVVSLRVELLRLRFHDVDSSPAAAAGAGQLLVDQLIRGWPATVPLPPFPAAWRTDAVVGLARAAAEDGRFAALPVLADALEEVGCDDPLALAHLRTGTDHAPRCWVADWVLAAT